MCKNPTTRLSPIKDILSRPKQFHAQFQGDRPVRTIVSKSAARANITDRLETLARPKEHCNDHYFIDSRKPEESITKVKKGLNYFLVKILTLEN